MGVRIGNSTASLAALARPSQAVRSAPRGDAGVDFRRQPEPEPPRAGFGENSISLPGVSLNTIGRQLEAGRRVVPTAQELREEVQARLAEERARIAEQQAERLERAEANAPEVVRKAASAPRPEPLRDATASREARPAPAEDVPEPPGNEAQPASGMLPTGNRLDISV